MTRSSNCFYYKQINAHLYITTVISLYNIHSYMFRHLYVITNEFYICALLSYINA